VHYLNRKKYTEGVPNNSKGVLQAFFLFPFSVKFKTLFLPVFNGLSFDRVNVALSLNFRCTSDIRFVV